MKKSISRGISLPAHEDERLRKLAKKAGKAYSELVQEAVRHYLARLDEAEIEQSYAEYYSDPEASRADRDVTRWLQRLQA